MNSLVSTAEAQNGFYPTPKSVAYQLFDMIDTQAIREVLEPSAGKGDLLRAFGCYKNEKYQESLAEKVLIRKIIITLLVMLTLLNLTLTFVAF